MQADKLISSRIESVTSSTTGKEALNIMSKFRTFVLENMFISEHVSFWLFRFSRSGSDPNPIKLNKK